MVRRRKVSAGTLRKIAQFRREGDGADVIYDRLIEAGVPDFPYGTRDADVKWIFRHLKKIDVPDTSGPWSFAKAEDPAAARHVLDILDYVAGHSERRITQLTNAEAEWVIRIRLAYPDMPAKDVWETVLEVVGEEDPSFIDLPLALQGWRSEERQVRANKIIVDDFMDAWNRTTAAIDTLIEKRPDLAKRLGRDPEGQYARLEIPGHEAEEGSEDE